MLEKDIERKVCEYAKAKGFLVYKFTSPNRMSVPDRLFIAPNGCVFLIEFKRTGEKPTAAQSREHTRLRENNAIVYVVDNVHVGKFITDMHG